MNENKPKYFAYYTAGSCYEHEAVALANTFREYYLDYELIPINNKGNWQANTQNKAIVCRDMLLRNPNRPCIYIDADARVRQKPMLFDKLSCDIAAHRRKDGNELMSGTLYFGPTQKAREIVDLWIAENEKYKAKWDQANLQTVIDNTDCEFVNLPASYCWVRRLTAKGGTLPVIEHLCISGNAK